MRILVEAVSRAKSRSGARARCGHIVNLMVNPPLPHVVHGLPYMSRSWGNENTTSSGLQDAEINVPKKYVANHGVIIVEEKPLPSVLHIKSTPSTNPHPLDPDPSGGGPSHEMVFPAQS